MPRAARLLLLAVAAVAALALGACGNKKAIVTEADTEGPYITLDQLKYQVQISRILNPADVEDKAYLKGVSSGVAPAADEVWFAIFMRVQNTTDRPLTPADTFEMRDTTGGRYTALNLDANTNLFAYKPNSIEPGGLIPTPNSPPADNTIQGSELLFKVKTGSLYNRPVQLHISNGNGRGTPGVINLDI